MEHSYKHIFIIQRQLLKQSVPYDLLPVFFNFLGNVTETQTDLINENCLFRIVCAYKGYETVHFGTYCNHCNKMYDIYTNGQYNRHFKSKNHCKNLKINPYPDNPNINNIRLIFLDKFYRFYSYSFKQRIKLLESVKFVPITNIKITKKTAL